MYSASCLPPSVGHLSITAPTAPGSAVGCPNGLFPRCQRGRERPQGGLMRLGISWLDVKMGIRDAGSLSRPVVRRRPGDSHGCRLRDGRRDLRRRRQRHASIRGRRSHRRHGELGHERERTSCHPIARVRYPRCVFGGVLQTRLRPPAGHSKRVNNSDDHGAEHRTRQHVRDHGRGRHAGIHPEGCLFPSDERIELSSQDPAASSPMAGSCRRVPRRTSGRGSGADWPLSEEMTHVPCRAAAPVVPFVPASGNRSSMRSPR